jgi:hypothetical protein
MKEETPKESVQKRQSKQRRHLPPQTDTARKSPQKLPEELSRQTSCARGDLFDVLENKEGHGVGGNRSQQTRRRPCPKSG